MACRLQPEVCLFYRNWGATHEFGTEVQFFLKTCISCVKTSIYSAFSFFKFKFQGWSTRLGCGTKQTWVFDIQSSKPRLIGVKVWLKKHVYVKKTYTFAFEGMVHALLKKKKKAQVTGFMLYSFSSNIWQIHAAPSVLQNKHNTLHSSLCLIFLYIVISVSTPGWPASHEMTYFWNTLQFCSAYTKTKQIIGASGIGWETPLTGRLVVLWVNQTIFGRKPDKQKTDFKRS